MNRYLIAILELSIVAMMIHAASALQQPSTPTIPYPIAAYKSNLLINSTMPTGGTPPYSYGWEMSYNGSLYQPININATPSGHTTCGLTYYNYLADAPSIEPGTTVTCTFNVANVTEVPEGYYSFITIINDSASNPQISESDPSPRIAVEPILIQQGSPTVSIGQNEIYTIYIAKNVAPWMNSPGPYTVNLLINGVTEIPLGRIITGGGTPPNILKGTFSYGGFSSTGFYTIGVVLYDIVNRQTYTSPTGLSVQTEVLPGGGPTTSTTTTTITTVATTSAMTTSTTTILPPSKTPAKLTISAVVGTIVAGAQDDFIATLYNQSGGVLSGIPVTIVGGPENQTAATNQYGQIYIFEEFPYAGSYAIYATTNGTLKSNIITETVTGPTLVSSANIIYVSQQPNGITLTISGNGWTANNYVQVSGILSYPNGTTNTIYAPGSCFTTCGWVLTNAGSGDWQVFLTINNMQLAATAGGTLKLKGTDGLTGSNVYSPVIPIELSNSGQGVPQPPELPNIIQAIENLWNNFIASIQQNFNQYFSIG